jgi:hypothetical protein
VRYAPRLTVLFRTVALLLLLRTVLTVYIALLWITAALLLGVIGILCLSVTFCVNIVPIVLERSPLEWVELGVHKVRKTCL